MPKEKTKGKPPAAPAQTPPPAAAATAAAPSPEGSTKFNAGEYKFAAWTGGKSPKLFAKTKEEMTAQLGTLSPRELSQVVLYQRLEVKPKVTIDLPGEGS